MSFADIGEGAVIPNWITKIIGGGETIDPETVAFFKKSKTSFYAWHWYGEPKDPSDAIKNMQAMGAAYDCPTFATEFMSCDLWKLAAGANISHMYWHYSSYCNTGPDFGNRRVPFDTFGACILGWAGGSSTVCEGGPPGRTTKIKT